MQIVKTKSFKLAVNEIGDKSAKKLAILLPGRLDTKDYTNFVSHQKFLAGKGFFTICFDPPGTWDSPGSINLFTTTNYLKAVNELVEYYGDKPTFLIGHSRGGTVAMLVATTNGKVAAFATVNSAFGGATPPNEAEVKQGFYRSGRDLPPGTTKTKQQRIFKLPLEYFYDAQKFDALTKLKDYKKPKLFFYAENDEFMTPNEFLNDCDAVHEPKEVHWLNCDHDYRYYPRIVEEVNKVIGKFVDKYLK